MLSLASMMLTFDSVVNINCKRIVLARVVLYFDSMEKAPYLDAILQAVVDSGRSERDISREATGNATAIAMLKTGRVPSAERLRALCDTLGLEFYVGQPRESSKSGFEVRETQTYLMSDAHLKDLESGARTLNRVVVEAGGDPIPDHLRSALLGLDETREAATSRLVDVIELASAAGAGAADLDENVVGHVWFRHEWLDRRGLDPTQCVVIGVRGESMEPTLPEGCSILVNRASRRRREGRIYVVRTDDGLVVKRLGKTRSGNWRLMSDHPSWRPVSWSKDARWEVIGQVRWMARTL